ncbi:hypothetical protein LTR37_006358 [Vermiconidia calcicola]|uniref:Uncharacterized protein n=1 Tax=Vermiconidia calcicola TaxID=1690605 RepID=A0ACC3NGP3_9PEZI|nr:hypothetical protein LTR37_006358 [Vermiconidia calcicola]
MATTNPTSEETATTSQYRCKTQDHVTPSVGFKPSVPISSKDHEDSIVVGYGPIVPRWDVVKEPGRKLQYLVRTGTFPNDAAAELAASAFKEAADEWNKLKLGLEFAATKDRASANFYLRYLVNPDVENMRDVLAEAFFPSEEGQDVIVYSHAFESGLKSLMPVVFLHELGHVLGLRHEFAVELEGRGAIRFMGEDKNSIMAYEPFPTKITESDANGLKAFYKLDNGHNIEPDRDQPITDFSPQLRAIVRRRRRQGATTETSEDLEDV